MKIFLTALLFFSGYISDGQVLTISGTVKDQNGAPIVYATIVSAKTGIVAAKTYHDGNFRIICINNDTLICTHVNYKEKKEKIEGNNIINFSLEKAVSQNYRITVLGKNHITEAGQVNNRQRKTGDSLADIANYNSMYDSMYGGEHLTRVEFPSCYAGGNDSLQSFLGKNVVYPDSALKANINGVVKVGLIIGKDGCVKDVKLVKGINKLCDNAILDVITKMPCRWKPAVQNGANVESYEEISVVFKMQD